MENKPLRKPEWIRVKLPANNQIAKVKGMLRSKHQCTVCEEAACPNLAECFNRGTATFMIMGDTCTRNCHFCNVKHGVPVALDLEEPENLAKTACEMGLKYVVMTSVTRDDLPDGGAQHFVNCIQSIRKHNPDIKIEILVPDFRHCLDSAFDLLAESLPDVFNHNIETVPRLYKTICSSADYDFSLKVLSTHKGRFPAVPTKSGLMVGLGETNAEIEMVMQDLRKHHVTMLTIGQYLQPSQQHVSVQRYVTPKEFVEFARLAKQMGFTHVASGPLVRSSYQAEQFSQGSV